MATDHQNHKKRIKMRLQTKFLISILFLEALLMGAIILVVEHQMRTSILEEFIKRGLSSTKNLAVINNDFVTTYNYVKIDQSLERFQEENDLLYVAVVLFDGEVISYKGLDGIKEKILTGDLNRNTLAVSEVLVQYDKWEDKEFCDISVPIFLKDERWATVRAGFSLDAMQTAIVKTRKILLIIGGIALFCGYLASILLARRITRPIGDLVKSVQAITYGKYQHPIRIRTYDEVGYLGQRFMAMQETLHKQFQQLTETNLQLATSNERLQSEISERLKKDEQIYYLAFYDNITGLPNRTFLRDYLHQALLQAKLYRQSIAVLFLDLDNFKRINDTMGHKAGDELLADVARRLLNSMRERDCIAREELNRPTLDSIRSEKSTVVRLGGDEFILVLTGIRCAADAAIVARRIQQMLSEPFTLGGHQIYVTTSIGISVYPGDGNEAENLIKRADTAMYYAKENGKNCYHFYEASMDVYALERLALENSLRESIKNNHFVLYYQPKADACTGQIVGMEALIRWLHPDKGLVSPAQFIPIAEETGLIVPLGEWALHTACTQAKAWQSHGLPPLRVSVNLSVAQFKQENLKNIVVKALETSGLESQYLELELTESLIMENLDKGIPQLDELKTLGIQLSIDDFGTGYSSLNYLKRLPIDTLKIDRSFIQDIGKDPDDAAIVTATIALGHNLHLRVIAEGVEDEIQLEFLRSHGCDEIQGYFLSRPLPPDDFFEYMRVNAFRNTLSRQVSKDQIKLVSLRRSSQSQKAGT